MLQVDKLSAEQDDDSVICTTGYVQERLQGESGAIIPKRKLDKHMKSRPTGKEQWSGTKTQREYKYNMPRSPLMVRYCGLLDGPSLPPPGGLNIQYYKGRQW